MKPWGIPRSKPMRQARPGGGQFRYALADAKKDFMCVTMSLGIVRSITDGFLQCL